MNRPATDADIRAAIRATGVACFAFGMLAAAVAFVVARMFG